jgi:Glycosyl transferases group 1
VLTGSDTGNLAHVMKQAVELGLSGQVFFPGFVPRDDLNALYRDSIALVFPSYFGPDNFPPLEAFALGVPVVAANVSGAEEQIGQAALLFDPSDPSDIASKIKDLCHKPGLRKQMIAKGREIAKVRTPEAYIATLCSFLDNFERIRRCWGATYQCIEGSVGAAYDSTLEEGIDFKRQGMPAFMADVTGLSAREAWGRWTDGDVAQFRFDQPLPAKFDLELSCFPFASNMGRDVTVRVGSFETAFRMAQADAATVSIHVTNDDRSDAIFIDIPNPTSPAANGVSTDERRLGIALLSLKIKLPATEAVPQDQNTSAMSQ